MHYLMSFIEMKLEPFWATRRAHIPCRGSSHGHCNPCSRCGIQKYCIRMVTMAGVANVSCHGQYGLTRIPPNAANHSLNVPNWNDPKRCYVHWVVLKNQYIWVKTKVDYAKHARTLNMFCVCSFLLQWLWYAVPTHTFIHRRCGCGFTYCHRRHTHK